MKTGFTIPFYFGVVFLFTTLLVMYANWFSRIGWKNRVRMKNAMGWKWFIGSCMEVFRESLLHLRIRKVNPRLWYMHMSLAFGWFLLIIAGHAESVYHSGKPFPPLSHAIFLDYFTRGQETLTLPGLFFNQLMDLLLLFILSGLALAIYKRFRSGRLGMKKKPRHQLPDRLALSFLWIIFPARLLAESLNHACYGGGGFLSAGPGNLIPAGPGTAFVSDIAWWVYSLSLGAFFTALPFSRYMHILTEIPHIFLKNAGTSVVADEGIAMFHAHACSSCGICMNTCQLNDSGRASGQSIHFVRNYRKPWPVKEEETMNCLLCGRCRTNCPVRVDTAGLRMNERIRQHSRMLSDFGYAAEQPLASGRARVVFFGGCMTRLSPAITESMVRIFQEAGESYLWVDKDEQVCCGRPLFLSGQMEAFYEMARIVRKRLLSHRPGMIVTSCPICLEAFRNHYNFKIPVLHHSQYLLQLIREGRLAPCQSEKLTVYHDPCELGRGLGIYGEPREVLSEFTWLRNREYLPGEGLCCGGSLAEMELEYTQKTAITGKALDALLKAGTEQLVTSCPLCRKTFRAVAAIPVKDLAEVVAEALPARKTSTRQQGVSIPLK